MSRSDQQQAIRRVATEMEPWLVLWRRDLHRHPEVGWTEFRTAALVAAQLRTLGWRIRLGRAVLEPDARLGLPDQAVLEQAWQEALNAGAPQDLLEPMRGGFTAVVAELFKGPGPVIAFRFDLDALPIQEAQDPAHAPFAGGWASTRTGTMHACGHDGHTAIGLGLGRLLSALDGWRGTVRLIFQPAEEGCRGALPMTAAGVVDDVDYLFGCHLGLGVPQGEVVAGSVGFLASTKLEAIFSGRAAHAGLRPEEGRSALLAGASAVLGLHSLPQYSGGVARVNVGALHAGDGYNVVPSRALLRVETRSDQPHINLDLDQRSRSVLAGAAEMFGCQVAVKVQGQATSADSDLTLAAVVGAEAEGVPGVRLVHATQPFGASEDFTHLMERVRVRGGQACHTIIGANLAAGHHNPRFDFAESVLMQGVQLLGRLAIRLSSTPV